MSNIEPSASEIPLTGRDVLNKPGYEFWRIYSLEGKSGAIKPLTCSCKYHHHLF